MTFINSAANDNIKRWRKISEHPRGAKKIGSTLAEGIHLAEVICQKRPLTRAVVVRENNVQSDVLALAERVAEATGAKLLTVTDKLYDAVCPVENGTGIMVEVAATFADRPGAADCRRCALSGRCSGRGQYGYAHSDCLGCRCSSHSGEFRVSRFLGSKGLACRHGRSLQCQTLRQCFGRRDTYAFCRTRACSRCTRRPWTCSVRRDGKRGLLSG